MSTAQFNKSPWFHPPVYFHKYSIIKTSSLRFIFRIRIVIAANIKTLSISLTCFLHHSGAQGSAGAQRQSPVNPLSFHLASHACFSIERAGIWKSRELTQYQDRIGLLLQITLTKASRREYFLTYVWCVGTVGLRE